ncbi:uncharacterized protein [Diabrotica undecimpunctata]|uniref:uncharacterized protein n=1 Tax=Diabrotica undecimpunctata TaxID=50387 RepID=UPI003B641E10
MRLEPNTSLTGIILKESVEYTLDSYEKHFVPEPGYNDPCCSNEQNCISEYFQSSKDEPIIIQELTSSSTFVQPTSWLSEYIGSAEDEPITIHELTSPSMSVQPGQHINSSSTDGILFSEDQNSTSLVKPTNEYSSDDELIADPHYIPENNSVLMTNNNSTSKSTLERKKSRQQLKKTPDTRKARELRKKNRNSGKSYVTKNGKIIPERPFQPLPLCRAKCKTKITESQLKAIFSEYWSLGSYDKRAAYIASLFTIHDKKSQRPRTDDPDKEKFRLKTYKYFLRIDGSHISVCRKCFLVTFNETDNFIKVIALKKRASPAETKTDSAQGTNIPPNKWSEEKLEEVSKHILSFPSYESHYSRAQTNKKFLPSHLTLEAMYSLYKESYQNPVSYPYYRSEFHKLNLSFKKPQTDTCHKCDKFVMLLKCSDGTEKESAEIEKENHMISAEQAYQNKKQDKLLAQKTKEMKCFTFDLQQCLPTPLLKSSVAFYKRQLWTFNLTVMDENGKSKHFMWHECIAKRGANEVGSCLYKVFLELPPEVTHVVLYSDTCGGQNKNSHISSMIMSILQSSDVNVQVVDHKFMVPGHTHMEVDVAHSMIEKKKKRSHIEIFLPHDWYQLVRSTSSKFEVVEMARKDFFDFASLLKGPLVSRKKDDQGEPFRWHDVQWLHYRKENNGKIFFKKSLNTEEPFKEISFIRRNGLGNLVPPLKYKADVPINKEKKKDLLDLLPLIPTTFHGFYENLPSSETALLDYPGIDEDIN